MCPASIASVSVMLHGPPEMAGPCTLGSLHHCLPEDPVTSRMTSLETEIRHCYGRLVAEGSTSTSSRFSTSHLWCNCTAIIAPWHTSGAFPYLNIVTVLLLAHVNVNHLFLVKHGTLCSGGNKLVCIQSKNGFGLLAQPMPSTSTP